MHGFRKIHQIHNFSRQHLFIQYTHRPDSHHRTPVGMFLQGSSNLGLPLHRKHFIRIAVHRILEAESIVEACQTESGQISGRRHKRTIKSINPAIKEIHIILKSSQ